MEDHIQYVRDREFNDFRYAIDGTKLEKMGWEAKTSFEDGMKATGLLGIIGLCVVEWYQSHPHHWDNIESALDAHPTLPNVQVNPMVL